MIFNTHPALAPIVAMDEPVTVSLVGVLLILYGLLIFGQIIIKN